jgi:hypothetical protein
MITVFELARRGLNLLWALVFVTIGAWALSYAAPSWSAKAHALFSHYIVGWTEAACDRNKEACLASKHAELDALHSELATAITALANQKGKIAHDLADRERDLAANAALLEEGRRLYAQAIQIKTTVRFVGREYTADALKRQLEVLFQEGPALQALVTQVRTMDEALDRKLNDLIVKKTKVRAARDLLPSQIELVRANTIIGDIDATLRDVTKLSDTVSADVAELKDIGAWLATTSELIQRKVEAEHVPTDFEKWLGDATQSTAH